MSWRVLFFVAALSSPLVAEDPFESLLNFDTGTSDKGTGKTGKLYKLSLWKEKEVLSDGSPSPGGSGYFVCNASLGSKNSQELRFALDFSGKYTWAISSDCRTASCKTHQRYKVSASQTAVDVNENGMALGTVGGPRVPRSARAELTMDIVPDSGSDAETLKGSHVREDVCLGLSIKRLRKKHRPICTQLTVIAVSSIQEGSMSRQNFDGIIGLAPPPNFGPGTSFLGRMGALVKDGIRSKRMGLYVGDDGQSAELVFGGYDRSRVKAGSIAWLPLLGGRDFGQWMVALSGVRVGKGNKHPACKSGDDGCYGLLQLSSPDIGMHPTALPAVMSDILSFQSQPSASGKRGPCNLPDLTFYLEDEDATHPFVLKPEDYARGECEPSLKGMDLEGADLGGGEEDGVGERAIVLGEPFFRRNYVIFDWETERIGFGRATADQCSLPGASCAAE